MSAPRGLSGQRFGCKKGLSHGIAPAADTVALVAEGHIRDSKTIIGLLLARDRLAGTR